MAVEMLQENPTSPTTISPRISFSHYLCQKENYPYYSDLNSDFDFCFHPAQKTSSADELFCDEARNLEGVNRAAEEYPGKAFLGDKEKQQFELSQKRVVLVVTVTVTEQFYRFPEKFKAIGEGRGQRGAF
nr:uncharacterized protein LOC109163037 [Ipomoea trifida]